MMKDFRLLTWLDVRRIIAQKTRLGSQLPERIVRISCFSDALEVGIKNPEDREAASGILKNWFGDWYEKDESFIHLDIDDARLPVEFIEGEEKSNITISLRPLWEEISYLKTNKKETDQNIKLPASYTDTDTPKLIAFHSFKGGVGRTLHLAAYLFALQEQAKELNQAITILVIDADLEAPGLTYWNLQEKQKPSVCFIDFLECYQYSPVSPEKTLSFFAEEIHRSVRKSGMTTLYFLPAFLKEEQLLNIYILPEHLAKNLQNSWECSDSLYKLGQAVKADYILIDLRAGLSEISSPILFDPRIQRFLVTSLNEQSRQGTQLILEQLSHAAPPENLVSGDDCLYYDPSVIISMLTPELKDLPAFSDALEQFEKAYIQPNSDNDLSTTRLEIKETDFHQELLYINNWEEARNKLNATSVIAVAKEWAYSQLSISQSSSDNHQAENQQLEKVKKLEDLCKQYIYAESGEGKNLLITEPLRNLANNFTDKLPCVVSIGAKGSGKTFNYLQLSHLKYWEEFLRYNEPNLELSTSKTYIFPLLQSTSLQDEARNICNEARNEVRKILDLPEFSPFNLTDRIRTKINDNDSNTWSEGKWAEFWIDEIAQSLGIETNSLHTIDDELKDKLLRVIFLFDGLENVFSDISTNQKQKKALIALIEYLPSKLSEIRQANLGMIIFVRLDFVRSIIVQNLQQFQSQYRAYELSWDYNSFLRLVLWLCCEAKVINADESKPENLSIDDIKEKLQQLWGKKLGADNSKEAYSDYWIFYALTDFNGRLQARDIVRFIFHAAENTVNDRRKVKFEKWSNSRLLPPQAIRNALKPCSDKKVEEAKQEYSAFADWVDKKLDKLSDKKIPFDIARLDIDADTLKILKDMGVIYEDRDKEEAERFYIPEIFREGLRFSATVARPRVIALKRKILDRLMSKH